MHWCREVKQFASATISQKRRFAESFWFAVFSVVIARSSIESERSTGHRSSCKRFWIPAFHWAFERKYKKKKQRSHPQPFHLDSIKLRSQGSIPVTQSLPGLEIGCWPCCCFSEDIFGHPLRTFQTLRVRGFSFLLLLLGQRLQPQDGWFSTRLVWGKWGAWVTNAEICMSWKNRF